MKKWFLLLILFFVSCGPVHHPVHYGPEPVSYETLAQIHRGLQKMEDKEKEMEAEVVAVWSEHDKTVLSGVQYFLEDTTYYWHENHFHYRNRPSIPDGLTPRTRMVWVAICNPNREKHIFENGTRQ